MGTPRLRINAHAMDGNSVNAPLHPSPDATHAKVPKLSMCQGAPTVEVRENRKTRVALL